MMIVDTAQSGRNKERRKGGFETSLIATTRMIQIQTGLRRRRLLSNCRVLSFWGTA